MKNILFFCIMLTIFLTAQAMGDADSDYVKNARLKTLSLMPEESLSQEQMRELEALQKHFSCKKTALKRGSNASFFAKKPLNLTVITSGFEPNTGGP
ncbi:MAG: hypothetical protein K2X90_01090 [Candidatus Babeliaceae bacterium]|nr:hypothetical protein [Candidatus Babeliaceae bacterium]